LQKERKMISLTEFLPNDEKRVVLECIKRNAFFSALAITKKEKKF